MLEINGKHTTALVYVEEIDEATLEQIHQIVNHIAFTNPIRIMPDTHAGASNSVIGFTMELADKIIPNTVGVDIGCGMNSVCINTKKQNLDFEKIDKKIRQIIPVGNDNAVQKKSLINFERQFWYNKATEKLYTFITKYNKKFNTKFSTLDYNYSWFEKMCKRINADNRYIEQSLGSLGGGNHFIEIGESNIDKSIWLTIHSGSRNLGTKIANYHSNIAKKDCGLDIEKFEKEFDTIKKELINLKQENLIFDKKHELTKKHSKSESKFPVSMSFLTGENMFNYFVDMIFAQVYAEMNRYLMIDLITKSLDFEIIDKIESIHNYIDFDDMIIRKGAISAYKNQRIIIPFNMADGILICKGKSNEAWNYSAPHGAGRLMSRSKAKEEISLQDFEKIMSEKNIFSTSVKLSTLDEAPQAYKNADIIEKAITPTAEILFKIKPLYNLKG